jgi:hypothetical protein
MQRRTLFKLGIASAALLAVAGGTLALLEPGIRDARLSPSGRMVFSAVGRALLEGSLPASPEEQRVAMAGLLDRVDGLVAALPPHAQEELSQLLALLASAGGRRLLAGLDEDWPSAPVPAIQQALQSMRTSSVALRQQAYQALHDIVGGAYFSDATTWALLGYPGPTKI